MALFGGKKKEPAPLDVQGSMIGGAAGFTHEPTPPPQMDMDAIPVDAVLTLRQQGLTNNQIIQTLQRQGYNTDPIFEAINQADIKGGVESIPPGQMEQMGPLDNPMPEQYPEYQQQPAPMGFGGGMGGGGAGNREQIEEIAEAIINEKWESLTKNITKVVEWKDKTDERLTKIEQSIDNLREDYDKLHEAIIGKISEYDKNIINVGTEIKAMEKVFQKILPTLTENVNELSRVTGKLKEAKGR